MRKSSWLGGTALVVTASLLLAGCSGGGDDTGSGDAGTEEVTISAPLSGQLGDQSFMDSANDGLQRAAADLGVKVSVIEAGADDAPAWERNLTEASASGENDLIVTGGTVMASTLERVAAQFPDQQYLIFDSESVGDNVTGISYAQNEGAFLVGALAAIISTNPDSFPRSTGANKIGLVGGMDIPVIRDFAVGYEQGAKAISPDITVDLRFVGDFESAQGAYDITTAIFNDGADVVYQVAGAAGLGVLQAGADSGRYAIGTDSDQNGIHPESTPASAIKSVGNTVYTGIQQFLDGKLELGTTTVGNIANDGVGIAYNDDLVPAEFQDQIDALRQQVIDGEITVDSAL
ncbi:BMP family protein [Amnibacterium flavum]|uniref:BMP family ABC transporter substrate-binding protein n=1 Tax=Amnibacterium flavum TaxID=2173173 RepID=A0A2V1HZJ7_9MICO|nr:BMP family ABC transporter substrate-binding protein [Amnibacterium flavum]PVZ96204.1 BMP family ABC transporter substrate-binding protein [Amnibacterium flavum]